MSTPFFIGLTGGIGSGKTTAAQELARLDAQVVSGDELGRIALESSPQLLSQIKARFGKDVFEPNGTLLRRALGQRVFADPRDADWLTRLTFPSIYRLWREAASSSRNDVVVFDAALIFEWGIEDEFDLMLSITASPQEVRDRTISGGRFSLEEVEARIASQIPIQTKIARADVALSNDGTPEELRQKIREFWAERVQPELQHRRAGIDDSSR